MTTLANTSIPKEVWINIQSSIGVSLEKPVIIQNVGTTDLYYSASNSQPAKNAKAYKLFKRGDFITAIAGIPTWIFSTQAEGAVNAGSSIDDASAAVATEIILAGISQILVELASTVLSMESQNCEIIKHLRMLAVQNQEIWKPDIDIEDID